MTGVLPTGDSVAARLEVQVAGIKFARILELLAFHMLCCVVLCCVVLCCVVFKLCFASVVLCCVVHMNTKYNFCLLIQRLLVVQPKLE